MKNFERLDYNPFTLYVDTFHQPRHSNTHQHEDILTYCLYANAQPILVDAGRPSYNTQDYVGAFYHCGFSDPAWPLRPKPRFFFSSKMLRDTTLKYSHKDQMTNIEANNHFLGLRKQLNISLCRERVIVVDERLESYKQTISPKLYHWFADLRVEQRNPQQLYHTTTHTLISYSGVRHITLVTAQRALGYGETIACTLAIAEPLTPFTPIQWIVQHGS